MQNLQLFYYCSTIFFFYYTDLHPFGYCYRVQVMKGLILSGLNVYLLTVLIYGIECYFNINKLIN